MQAFVATYLFFIASLYIRAAAVRRVSVPEEHYLTLDCNGLSDSPETEWRHGVSKIIATKHGEAVAYLNQKKYEFMAGGSLRIRDLQMSDAGEYLCNSRLMADVDVLEGKAFSLPVGRTLLLPCDGSDDRKQLWSFRRNKNSKRMNIFTMFRNGTVKREREDPWGRFVLHRGALEILQLVLEDTGKYFCNSNLAATLTVMEVHQHHTTTVVMETVSSDSKAKATAHKRVLMVSVIGLCVLLLLSVLLISFVLRHRRNESRRKYGTTGSRFNQDMMLQTHRLAQTGSESSQSDDENGICPDTGDSELHYASLGHQNWREKGRVQDKTHQVIYSTIAIAVPDQA
ncbi:uncharacterized protein LOC114770228 [Denticeps clupeoides]|uniref:uncharacterized protein LOC114770228 n=1 Tax=Denticeps clupeoides TaxID=299321 RepID=UPI0010A55ED6|nr:uncharacterized protein LOC114770228 [Denticeps clupeoides]